MYENYRLNSANLMRKHYETDVCMNSPGNSVYNKNIPAALSGGFSLRTIMWLYVFENYSNCILKG